MGPPPGSCTDQTGTVRGHGERWQDDPQHPCAWLSCDSGRISVDMNISRACRDQPKGFDCVASRAVGKCCYEYFCNRSTTLHTGESSPSPTAAPPERPRFFVPCLTGDGQKHSHGTQWTSQDGCTGYSCFNGNVTEVPIICSEVAPYPHCVLVPAPGQCCPQFVCPPTVDGE